MKPAQGHNVATTQASTALHVCLLLLPEPDSGRSLSMQLKARCEQLEALEAQLRVWNMAAGLHQSQQLAQQVSFDSLIVKFTSTAAAAVNKTSSCRQACRGSMCNALACALQTVAFELTDAQVDLTSQLVVCCF